jgi:hypothetical protein
MLSRGEDVEVNALVERGWNISAIARHLGRDLGTIRNYVNGRTTPGVRRPAGPDPLERFSGYVSARFVDDPTCGPRRSTTRSWPWAMTAPM